MIRNVVQQGKAFRVLVGVYPYATDPSSSNVYDQPEAIRQTVTVAVANKSDCMTPGQMGLVSGVVSNQIGTITVANNDFTSPAELILGNYRLLSNIDFVPGAGVNQTATSLAAAISQFPGFSATANLAVVSVLYGGGSAADVDFYPRHYGAVVNFTMTPTDDYMEKGSPQLVAPILTS
ncbi:MAG: hypothetical protein WC824_12935 [Bacteroidota bacterium]|jgi:hypothetical protein